MWVAQQRLSDSGQESGGHKAARDLARSCAADRGTTRRDTAKVKVRALKQQALGYEVTLQPVLQRDQAGQAG
jgi:hypothetical protein